jgi:hypothetical protein
VNQGQALIPQNGELTAEQEWDKSAREYTRRLFSNLRRIFSWRHQLDRVVFWVDERRGKMTVRQVKNLSRTRKSEDLIIAQTIPDLDAVRVHLGNYATECYLTPTRWELYTDFDLQDRVGVGRFDKKDLLAEVNEAKADKLLAQNIFPVGNWDFDALVDLHRCPLCHKLFSSFRIVFVSTEACEACRKVPGVFNVDYIIDTLMRISARTTRKMSMAGAARSATRR